MSISLTHQLDRNLQYKLYIISVTTVMTQFAALKYKEQKQATTLDPSRVLLVQSTLKLQYRFRRHVCLLSKLAGLDSFPPLLAKIYTGWLQLS